MPTALGEPGSIDLLIPCQLAKQQQTDGLSTSFPEGENHCWVDIKTLQARIPALDSKLVDKALQQVRH